jgi:general secretion pathway protein J
MKRSTTNRSVAEGGFTLLEMLVAVTVLGLLVIGLTQGVRTGLNLWNVQTRRNATIAELDSTARVLRNVLMSIPIQPAAASGTAPVAVGFKGEPNRITFVGELPTGLGARQPADIAIEIKLGRVVMAWVPHRHETPAGPPPAPTETELISNVDDLQFAYWGSTSPTSAAAWLTQWDGPVLPALVRIRLGLPKGDPRHWPDLIVAPSLWSPSS